ncbi:hypothetical protein SRHO_G00038440, partial [Serrasalmus rhombeus]
MPSSLSSPSEHSHSQPPSPSLHDHQRAELSSASLQAAHSQEEFTLYRAVAHSTTTE